MIADTDAAEVGCVKPPGHWLDDLARDGLAVRDGLFPDALVTALADEARRLADTAKLRRAGVGREENHELNPRIRRDRVSWLNSATLAQVQFIEAMETLRREVNRALFLGLFDFEAHFALYEPGAFYARHVDAFRGGRNRVLSTVLYLNPNWREGDGGKLAVWAPDAHTGDQPLAVIAPEAGRLVVFLSEEIPHEVLVAHKARYSIAGWFRVRA